MKTTRVSTIRREQIVEAAIAVIAERGIQHLSLSEIEKKTGLARGQLMYYFHSKEGILLAVFDRLLQLMHARVESGNGRGGPCPAGLKGWERLQHFLTLFVLKPPNVPAFHSLQYTFLSQITHREDFRQRLANLYESWRVHMAEDFQDDLARKTAKPKVSPRLFASFVQAILHGLAMQRAADPDAYDRQEMLDLVLDVLGSYLHPPGGTPKNDRGPPSSVKSKAGRKSRPHRTADATPRSKKVNHA